MTITFVYGHDSNFISPIFEFNLHACIQYSENPDFHEAAMTPDSEKSGYTEGLLKTYCVSLKIICNNKCTHSANQF